jgi:hypothetical protein
VDRARHRGVTTGLKRHLWGQKIELNCRRHSLPTLPGWIQPSLVNDCGARPKPDPTVLR